MAHSNRMLVCNLKLDMNIGLCYSWMKISDEHDYHHPILRKPRVLVRYTGTAIYEYQCTQVEAPMAELKYLYLLQ